MGTLYIFDQQTVLTCKSNSWLIKTLLSGLTITAPVLISTLYKPNLFLILQESNPVYADVVKVIPTSNNGSSELVSLKHVSTKFSEEIFFTFQKIKYVWSSESESFQVIYKTLRKKNENEKR